MGWILTQLQAEQKVLSAPCAGNQYRTCLVSSVHGTGHHLGHDLIPLILVVPQVEAITARICLFLSNFPVIDINIFPQTTATPWKDASLSLWSIQEEPHACVRKKYISSDIYKTTQKATGDSSTL